MSPFFNQSDVNLEPMAAGRLAFSRTSGSLRLSTQISDWFLVILPFFLIGFFEYLAFCYKKLDRKAFKQDTRLVCSSQVCLRLISYPIVRTGIHNTVGWRKTLSVEVLASGRDDTSCFLMPCTLL